MAFPMKKKPMMPPPGKKPDLVVAVGMPKPKADDMPMPSAPPMPAPDATGPAGAGDDDSDEKMDPSKALVSHADENCGNCEHYDASTGDCEKVSGVYAPDDRCWSYFEAMGDD